MGQKDPDLKKGLHPKEENCEVEVG